MRGAAEIVRDGGVLFRDIARLGEKEESGVEYLFARAIRSLAKGQPSMAPVLNLLNLVCFSKEKHQGNWTDFLDSLKSEILPLLSSTNQVGENLEHIPRQGDTLITFSNSSTVSNVIVGCYERFQWPRKVICGEGRPLQEGVAMARRIHASGVNVQLTTDAAMMSLVDTADAVWVGGDTLSRQGLVNKIGSKALAQLATFNDIPFVSIMSRLKLLAPSLLPFSRFLSQNPREIVAEGGEGLEIINEYYEIVPLKYVSWILTEQGLETPVDLVESIENTAISPLFRELVTRQ